MDEIFNITVSYSQIAVFDSSLVNPFNDWTPSHVRQGFSWRRESVSFATLDEGGRIDVTVKITSSFDLSSTTVRAIMVPFRVSEMGTVEIGSITDTRRLTILAGEYRLYYESGRNQYGQMWCRFTFVAGKVNEAEVILADAALSPAIPLIMIAKPA